MSTSLEDPPASRSQQLSNPGLTTATLSYLGRELA